MDQLEMDQLEMDLGIKSIYDEAWEGMPEFDQKDKTSFQSIHIHFKTYDDVKKFAELIGQKLTKKTRSIWFPQIEIERYADKEYIDES